MLACVSSLSDVVSYKIVRNSKKWLTSHEAIFYIAEHCPAMWSIMMGRKAPFYSILYSWGKGFEGRFHAPRLEMKRTKDDGCRPVIFWSVESISKEEKRFSRYFKHPPVDLYEKDYHHENRVRFLGEEETQKLEDVYNNSDFDGRCKLRKELYG